MKTWVGELAFVGFVLTIVLVLTGGGWLETVGALAVLAAFAHAQVSERMREQEAAKRRPDTACHAWSTRYFVTKELLWLAYFVAHRSWAALVGVGVFLLYPLWRRWWRKRYPIIRALAAISNPESTVIVKGRAIPLQRVLELDLGSGTHWSGRVVLRLDHDASYFIADVSRAQESFHMMLLRDGALWAGVARSRRLQFFDDPQQPRVRFAMFEVVGEGGLESVRG